MKTLRNLFLDELADIYDAEKRIVKALPKLAKAATCKELRVTFQTHLKETEGHVKQLEKVFACFDQKARGKTCEATVGLLQEGEDIAEEYQGSSAINAALIAAAQKVEHYEIASYGCLHEWAELLDNEKAARLLQGILEEEKAANEALNERAHATSNDEALSKSDDAGTSERKIGAKTPAVRGAGRAGKSNHSRIESLA
ncbi:MAG TPA: ferritin-like domain-containing protein [Methylomirabilota bacterium]|nr:ferritin-like domain-containing protein [Methylomirabilota bacterium]